MDGFHDNGGKRQQGFESLAAQEQQYQDFSRLRSSGSILYGSIINYTKATIGGGGLLALPLCFKLAGIFPSLFMIVGLAVLNNFTAVSLVWVGSRLRLHDTNAVANHVFGSKGSFTLNCCMLLKCFGSLVSYLIIIGGVLPSAVGGNERTMGMELRTWVLLLVAVVLLLPLSTLHNVNPLRHGNTFSITIGISLIFVIIYQASSPAPPTMVPTRVGWFAGTVGLPGILSAWSILVYSFSSQHMAFPIYQELTPSPSLASFKTVSMYSNGLVALLYALCGACGYMVFAEDTQDNFLKNLNRRPEDSGGVVETGSSSTNTLLLLYTVTLVFSYQMTLHCVRPCFAGLLSKGFSVGAEQDQSDLDVDTSQVPRIAALFSSSGVTARDIHRLVGYFLVASSTAVAICIPELSLVLGLTGATACAIVSFVFPGMLLLYHDVDSGAAINYSAKIPALALLVFGSLGGAVATLQIATSQAPGS